ncbi:MAG: pyruvate kinase, partial [Planctomycetota bacterium]
MNEPTTGAICSERGRKRTKIVATIGPASEDRDILNMSHGSHEDHARRLTLLRELSDEIDRPVAVLADLQGPKIRLTKFADGSTEWAAGDQVVITTEDMPLASTDGKRVGSTYRDVHCSVLIGGTIKSSKGINMPGCLVSAPPLTDKDKDDLAWAMANDVDYVALSFVRNAQDIRGLRRRISDAGRRTSIIAKIERPEAVDDIENILVATDGIMVARGDLGIEMSSEKLPVVQKHLIARGKAYGKLVITATQMLESMVNNPIPTRAETSDVANAIFDGTDAVMLSAESASGKYPVEAVREMLRIAETAEPSAYMSSPILDPDVAKPDATAHALSRA